MRNSNNSIGTWIGSPLTCRRTYESSIPTSRVAVDRIARRRCMWHIKIATFLVYFLYYDIYVHGSYPSLLPGFWFVYTLYFFSFIFSLPWRVRWPFFSFFCLSGSLFPLPRARDGNQNQTTTCFGVLIAVLSPMPHVYATMHVVFYVCGRF